MNEKLNFTDIVLLMLYDNENYTLSNEALRKHRIVEKVFEKLDTDDFVKAISARFTNGKYRSLVTKNTTQGTWTLTGEGIRHCEEDILKKIL